MFAIDHLRAFIYRRGPLAWLACAAVGGAVVFYVTEVAAGRTRLAQAEASLADARARLKRTETTNVRPTESLEVKLQNFYGRFPPVPAAAELVGKLEALATAKGLALDSGEYKLAAEQGLKLTRYQVTLPLKGNYAQVRPFLHEALQAVPTAALENITLRRERADNNRLEAQVRMVILLRTSVETANGAANE